MDLYGVALLAEGVDRNNSLTGKHSRWEIVALLAEGVDRNDIKPANLQKSIVALLAEGVDRNGAEKVL